MPPVTARAISRISLRQGDRIIGLQFHPEIRKEDATAFLRDCGEHLGTGPYVQTPDDILSNEKGFAQSKIVMAGVLSAMESAGA